MWGWRSARVFACFRNLSGHIPATVAFLKNAASSMINISWEVKPQLHTCESLSTLRYGAMFWTEEVLLPLRLHVLAGELLFLLPHGRAETVLSWRMWCEDEGFNFWRRCRALRDLMPSKGQINARLRLSTSPRFWPSTSTNVQSCVNIETFRRHVEQFPFIQGHTSITLCAISFCHWRF